MSRLPHLIVLCLVFGSMWLHGVVVMPSSEHVMAAPSCLEYCLSSVHTDTADEALVGTAATFPSPVIEHWGQVWIVDFSWAPSVDSHHDPSRILTTIKRE
ncbi:MAG: hypothetical protein NUV84_05605 [Candidatus Uhrbacteria bacterium]|nr:hypothetical protein [Candidatus Uhrbacteria bacterium]